MISEFPPESYSGGPASSAMIDLIPQMVCVIDDSGVLLNSNNRFREMTSLTHGQIAPWTRWLSEADAWAFQSNWLISLQTNEPFEFEAPLAIPTLECRMCLFQFSPNGTPKRDRCWYGTLTLLRNTGVIQREIAGINTHLGSRLTAIVPGKSAQHGSVDKYRKRSELLSEILDSLLEGVVVVDAMGQVQLANDAARDLFEPELLAQPSHEWPTFGLILRADQTPISLADLPTTQALEGEATAERELWLTTTDGNRFRCEMRAIPLSDGDGHIRGAVLVCRDVTKRRQMEEQLGQLQKLEAIGHLAAGIAHEINTPMQYVGDNLRFLQESFPELVQTLDDGDFLKQEIPPAISQSIEGVEHVVAIVRAMKEFAGGGPDDAVVVSLNRVVENVVAVTRNEWKIGVDVTLDLAADLPLIPGYLRELNQAIYHVFMNAVEAVRESFEGIGTIQVRTQERGRFIELTIGDSGRGIPTEIRPHVFNPFFTTKAPGRHSGQGLSMVLAVIVQRHRGTIEIHDDELGGAKFTICLPREW